MGVNVSGTDFGLVTGVGEKPSGGDALNAQLLNRQYSFQASAAINTVIELAQVTNPYVQHKLEMLVVVTNPSPVSAVTVILRNSVMLGGQARRPEVTRFSVPINTPDGLVIVVRGWSYGLAGVIQVSNDVALGAGDAFAGFVAVFTA